MVNVQIFLTKHIGLGLQFTFYILFLVDGLCGSYKKYIWLIAVFQITVESGIYGITRVINCFISFTLSIAITGTWEDIVWVGMYDHKIVQVIVEENSFNNVRSVIYW